ncbi:MliC family protein [Afifella pfennigii]|uniref:MliC family protein n=1 Tax=Afifella pfennigii TaxID=209897 RepID=UPI00054EEDF9|nr:MliC family protein [Afifella pfennigii]
MRRLLIFLCLCVASPALAQDGPSFDCGKAESSAEKLICGDAALAALDRRVSDRFAAALAAARGLDVGASQAVDELRAYQRGWIKGRDECWKADDLRACVEAAYLRREGALVAQWLLEEPTGTAFWTCGENPANEVVTTFFDTELPSLRFERGDSVDTGSLQPAASGSKYEGSFGRSIWIKGEEATYREPDPDGTSFECVLRQQQ